MEIGLFFSSSKVNIESKQANTVPKRDNDFGDFFTKLQNNDKTKMKDNSKKEKTSGLAEKSREDKPRAENEKRNKYESKTAETSETTTVESVTEEEDINSLREKQQSLFVKKLSDALGISPDEVMQILNQLNMQISDLINPEAIGDFVQALYGVDSKIDLLNIPQINEIFSIIEGTASEYLNSLEAGNLSNMGAQVADSSNITDDILQNASLQSDAMSAKADASIEGLNLDDSMNEVEQPVEITVATESKSANSQTSQSGEEQSNLFSSNDEHKAGMESELFDNNQSININTERQAISGTTVKAEQPVSSRDVLNQITESIKTEVRPNESEIRLVLRPESLGEVSLKIATQNGIVTAQFVAESQKVKEIIESNFNELKESLSEAGITVAGLSVSVGNNNDREPMQTYERERSKSSRRIAKIMADSGMEVEEEIQYVSEEDIVSSNVNYTA